MPVVLTPLTSSTSLPLVTAAEVTAVIPSFANLSTTAQTSLINSATGAINRATDRILGLATYTSLVYPGRTRLIESRQWPIANVIRVAANLQPIITVKYTGASLRASIAYTSTGAPGSEAFTGINLTVGGASVALLTFANYPTATLLTAAINAVSGWTATLTAGYATWATADLLTGIGTKGAIAQPVALPAMVDELDYDIDGQDRRRIKLLQPFGDDFRYPDRSYGGYGWAWLGLASNTRPIHAACLVQLTAGYATENVDAELKQAAYQTIRYFEQRLTISGVFQSKSSGEESWSLANLLHMQLPADIMGMLGPWRRADVV